MTKYVIKKHNQGFSIYKRRWWCSDKIHVRVFHCAVENDRQISAGSCLYLKDFSTLKAAREYKSLILDAEPIPKYRGQKISRYLFEDYVYYGHECKYVRYAGDWEHFRVFHTLENAKKDIDEILDYDKRIVEEEYE